jgi:hypothetical protein
MSGSDRIPEPMLTVARLEGIFMPHMRARRDSFYSHIDGTDSAARFAHYTSAEAALSIIRTKRIWMRNATCMTDYREVQHGRHMFERFFADETRKRAFFSSLDSCSPNAAEEAVALFDQWWTNIQFSTYISSISEHAEAENAHGRLSMWRAFGGNIARVAIVLRVPWFSGGAEALNVSFSPVSYFEEQKFHDILSSIPLSVENNREFLSTVERPILIGSIFNMLIAGVTCLKHEGFHEEREWRAIYSPHRNPSSLMKSNVETVAGIPQIIYKLPLDVTVDGMLYGLDLASMFDRLIIGPSQFSWPMYEAFASAMADIGVQNASNKIFVSGIPIRS